jgi:SAM-dependent methyltransferase
MKDWIKTESKTYDILWRNGYEESIMDDVIEIFPDLFSEDTGEVLDLGCGNAVLSESFKQYTGLDVSNEIIKQNRELKSGAFHHGSVSDLREFYEHKFDKLICFDTMEHIPIQMTGLVLSEISRLNFKSAYFKIHRGESGWKDESGNGLHRTVAGRLWWLEMLQNFFTVESETQRGILSFFKVKLKQ